MNEEEVDLRDYLRIIAKRKWLIIILVAVAAATSIIASYLQPKVYEASATIKINTAEDSPHRTGAAAIAYINSDEFKQKVSSERDHAQLLKDAKITPAPLSEADQVQIFVSHKDPRQAQKLANAVAGLFVKESRAKSALAELNKKILNVIESKKSYVERRIAEIKKNIEATEAKISSAGSSDTLVSILYTVRLNSLEEKLADLEVRKIDFEQDHLRQKIQLQMDKVKEARIISKATLPLAPERAGLKQKVLAASVLALVVALGLVFVLEQLERTKRKQPKK